MTARSSQPDDHEPASGSAHPAPAPVPEPAPTPESEPGPAAPADPALLDRRAAVAELGAALRELADAAVRSEADPDVLRSTADAARGLLGPLRERQRRRQQMPLTDDLPAAIRMYNPAIGAGSPIAPPMVIEEVGDGVVGRCTLGLAYEGPHMFGHGGISALLLDQLLGYAVAVVHAPGMTVELTTRYLRPVPLDTPLHLWATATPDAGAVIRARGAICLAERPDVPLVTATGQFVTLRTEQTLRIFAATERPARVDPRGAHD